MAWIKALLADLRDIIWGVPGTCSGCQRRIEPDQTECFDYYEKRL